MVKGSYSFDVLISSLIVIYMLFFFIQALEIIRYDVYVMQYKSKMEKLYLASQYFVYYSSKETYKSNPNIIESIDKGEVEKVREELGLKKLSVGFFREEGDCLVRLVYSNELKKLYVCG